MYKALLIFISIVSAYSSSYCQPLFEQFKTLENEVKYTTPEKLNTFAATLDTNNNLGKAISIWARGRANFWKSNYPEAYVQLEKVVLLLEDLEQHSLLGELYLDLSATLAVVDQNGKALNYLLEAKNIFEKIGDEDQIARTNISMAEMYRKIAEHDTALQILHKTKSIAEQNQYNYARYLNRLAAVHSENGDQDSSLYYSFKSLSIAREINEPDLMATAENEIGYIYRIRRQFEEALPRFESADSLWKSIGKYQYAVNAMHHISVIYGSSNRIEKSLNVTHEAYKLIKNKSWYRLEANLLEDLRNLQYQLNRPDSASIYEQRRLEVVINWKDQQYEINTKMVEALFTQKQNEQIIREQTVLLENEALEKEVIDRQRNNLIIISILIGLMLLIIFIYAYKQRQLKNKLTKENIEKEEKNEQLLKALSANEALVQEISHRVKNNLAVLSGLLNMQALRTNNEEVSKELQDSILRIESIATIHKKLYDKGNDAKVNLKEVVIELSKNILTAMGKNPIECLKHEIDECEIDIAQGVTFCLIINEVITNSCKYGLIEKDKKLVIEISHKKDTINCEIKEKGKGFSLNDYVTETTSLGLYLINLLGKQLKAQINWEKTEEYFIFSIEFKKDEYA